MTNHKTPDSNYAAGGAREPERVKQITAGLEAVRRRVEQACLRYDRDPATVRILPVTKYHDVRDIGVLQSLGVTEVAENRHPNGQQRADAYSGMKIAMIGRIQTNKANAIARWASSIHSVDSMRVARALTRAVEHAFEREQRNDLPEVFVQLSADGDQSRGGASAEDVRAIARDIRDNCPNLRLAGVMAMAPLGGDAAKFFRRANALRHDLEQECGARLELSAGMSGDLDEAVGAGSTIVRVGTAILGPRVLG